MRSRNTIHVQTRLEPDLYNLLADYANANKMYVAEALRVLVSKSLQGRVNLKELGYRDGLRRGLHESHKALSGALGQLMPQK